MPFFVTIPSLGHSEGIVYFWEYGMKILICDDEERYQNDLKVHVEEYMNNHFIKYEIYATIDSKEVFENEVSYDLAFLDIQMDDVDGISLAKELKKRNGKIVVFFVTSHNQFQDDAMDVRAFRFFEKPFDVNRLYSGLDKAMEYIDEAYVDVFLYNEKSHVRLPVDEIIYIKRENRRVTLVSTSGRFDTRESFDEWCETLPNSFFYQVHKSFLVNLHYVDTYKYTELYLTNGERIAIAPRKQAEFHKYWFAYLRRR